MHHARYLKQFLQPIKNTPAIIGKEKVKLYMYLEAQLISFRVREQSMTDKKIDIKIFTAIAQEHAKNIIAELILRRMLVPTDERKFHFYLVSGRQQGINVERVLQQLATAQASVA